MEPVVSKLRTKKTKSREKKAVKASAGRPPLREHSLVGLLIAVLDTVLLLYLLMVGLTPDTFWLPGMEEDQSVPVVGTR